MTYHDDTIALLVAARLALEAGYTGAALDILKLALTVQHREDKDILRCMDALRCIAEDRRQ